MTPSDNTGVHFTAMYGSVCSFSRRCSVYSFGMRGCVYLFSMWSSSSSFSIHTIAIVCVDHKDQALCVLLIVALQRTDLVLATDVLHREDNDLVLHCHDVKPYHQVRATYSIRLLSSIDAKNRATSTRASIFIMCIVT